MASQPCSSALRSIPLEQENLQAENEAWQKSQDIQEEEIQSWALWNLFRKRAGKRVGDFTDQELQLSDSREKAFTSAMHDDQTLHKFQLNLVCPALRKRLKRGISLCTGQLPFEP